MNLAWITDVHFDHARPSAVVNLVEDIRTHKVDAILITGDIATSTTVVSYLDKFQRQVDLPIYHVLGNHDLWGGRIATTHANVQAADHDNLRWLQRASPIPLTPTTALIGADGWYDGRAGNYYTGFCLVDMDAIHDFKGIGKDSTLALMQRLADKGTDLLVSKAETAISEGHTKIIMATHVPPFPRACTYRGGPSEADALPYFCNARMGEELVELADKHPSVTFTVLAGHTHGGGLYRARPNLTCHVGPATYQIPHLQCVLDVD